MPTGVDLAPSASMTYRPAHDLDVGFAVMGAKSVRRRHGVWWWTTETPLGPATVAFRTDDATVRADGWGPGVDWAFTALPGLLGRHDDPGGFRPDHPGVRAMAARFASLRVGRTGRWYEAVAMAAIGQRVVRSDASAARERLCRRHGTALGVGPANPFPTPEAVLRLADHDFHRVGIERSRARVIRVAATHADRLERLAEVPAADASRWLQRLPGVGPWTTALATSVAGGDPDAVPVGDLHIPRLVTWALTGVEGDDDAMLEALAPFAGHRQRVVRLVKMTGAGPPTHRPRPTRSDIRHL